jgi:rod shape-determining protein MreD
MMKRADKFFTPSQRTPEVLKCSAGIILPLLTLLSMALLPIPGLTPYSCMFVLCGIIYFSWWSPKYAPSSLLFLCGICLDSFYTGIFGTYALLFILLRLAIIKLREHQKFQPKTIKASLIAMPIIMGFFIIEWCITSLQLGVISTNSAYFVRCLLTLLCYPILHKLLSMMIIRLQS